ncbi:threonine aldolase family protein [Macromonas nakdongensis]|uniref:threonine aldolase family protein n=1 Tax=Macromonas nakdongensis TaxID=1843082 RepID=UPI00210086F3|nr:beta-eliminating lyase-related protein [Macromonas nakdongensis]
MPWSGGGAPSRDGFSLRVGWNTVEFGSDNQSGCSERVMHALAQANQGASSGYGHDAWTERAVARLREVFETDLEAYFVASGTAANCIALAAMVRPWQLVLAHEQAHVAVDESTAPEFFTGGARTVGVPSDGPRLLAADLQAHLARQGQDMPHNPQAGAVSITQATEAGLVYRVEEVAALTAVAHAHGLPVHMDGARFANAVAALGVSPAAATHRAGVDVMTLGATKNGCMGVETIVVFNRALSAPIQHIRKRSGHLLSKSRFLGAQIHAWLEDGHWLTLARQANRQAQRLSSGMVALPQVGLAWPTEANEVFLRMPRCLAQGLRQAGAHFYDWNPAALPSGHRLGDDEVLVRLVASFATSDADVEALLDCATRWVRR